MPPADNGVLAVSALAPMHYQPLANTAAHQQRGCLWWYRAGSSIPELLLLVTALLHGVCITGWTEVNVVNTSARLLRL
jgi:hypothetical protein